MNGQQLRLNPKSPISSRVLACFLHPQRMCMFDTVVPEEIERRRKGHFYTKNYRPIGPGEASFAGFGA